MNPTVIMAIWGRQSIVEVNLRLLAMQNCQIVVVCSINEDSNFVRGLKLPNIHIVTTSNNPLGKKWQFGVDHARTLGANPVIILGSDDFLSANFIEKACELSKYHDFVFFDNWFIHAQKEQKNYFLKYNMIKYGKPPLGSGRVYSERFLERHNWALFDTGKDWHLDDFAYFTMKSEDKILLNPTGMNILAVKGSWDTMNSLDKILSSDSIDWSHEKQIDQYFNFPKSVKETFQNL